MAPQTGGMEEGRDAVVDGAWAEYLRPIGPLPLPRMDFYSVGERSDRVVDGRRGKVWGKGGLRVMVFDPEGYDGDDGGKKDEYN